MSKEIVTAKPKVRAISLSLQGRIIKGVIVLDGKLIECELVPTALAALLAQAGAICGQMMSEEAMSA